MKSQYRTLFPVFGFVAGIVFTALIFFSYSYTNEDGKNSGLFFRLTQQVRSVRMDKSFEFAGEPVPINEDTRERLDRELSVNAYWQSATLLHIKLAHKHFPVIEKILKEQGIPEDFKYLSVAESSLRNATSSAGAKGYWQFMKPAATELGLEISTDVDERMHLEKSTLAACKYIKYLYSRFGTWTNAAGAYNVGPGSFARSQAEQKESNYYDMNINEETSRYVFRIIAIKEILANPDDFGYYLEDEHKYENNTKLKEITVDQTITDLADFAHQHGTTYRMLKYYNPWLLTNKLTVTNGKSYVIKLPA
ncbi:MAG: lytic transglycosylase domain-containing protein [Saprospiraceae bacterium]|nr:lytic transglycosylase domain-containing protein [Saprospiraceae bacterium]